MTAPQKLYGVTLKPRAKTPPRRLIETPASETHPDLMEAVRRAVAAYFTPSWTAISRQAGQAFHAKVDTDFTASWTAISREAGQ
jgi:hypothetical protein